MDLIDFLRNKDENFIGNIDEIKTGGLFGNRIKISCISNLTKKEILSLIEQKTNSSDIQITYESASPLKHQETLQGDEVKTLFMGQFPTKGITDNTDFKFDNPINNVNVKEWYREFRYLSPIIVDKNLKIIDGHVRLQIALQSNTEYVSIVVLDTDKTKSDALRLGLNRTSEFSKWDYDNVDPYVDSKPQLQPILEPIGFFSNNVLPTSFFSNTVMDYKYDKLNEQMKHYMQSESLFEWAELMKKRHESLEKEKKERENNFSRHSGLLKIKYTEKDLLSTYDSDEVLTDTVAKVTKIADTVTKNFDKERKPEMEAKGIQWQRTKLSSKQLVAKKHAEQKKGKNA